MSVFEDIAVRLIRDPRPLNNDWRAEAPSCVSDREGLSCRQNYIYQPQGTRTLAFQFGYTISGRSPRSAREAFLLNAQPQLREVEYTLPSSPLPWSVAFADRYSTSLDLSGALGEFGRFDQMDLLRISPRRTHETTTYQITQTGRGRNCLRADQVDSFLYGYVHGRIDLISSYLSAIRGAAVALGLSPSPLRMRK